MKISVFSSPRPRHILALGAGAALVGIGVCTVLTACGDDDNAGGTIDAGDERPPAHVPNAPITPIPDPIPDAGPDVPVTSLYPVAWDRTKSARDASLEASVRYCDSPVNATWQFCWDFGGTDAITGWQDVFADGGSVAAIGDVGDPARALQAKITKESGPGPKWAGVGFLLNIDDIPDAAAGVTLSFSFHIAAVQTYAVIGAIQIGTTAGPQLRGIAVYPDGCKGYPCIGETMHSTTDKAHWRPFDSTKWYRARMQLVPIGIGTGSIKWASTVTVGDAIVAQHTDDALPVGTSFPSSVNLFAGAIDTTIAGSDQVEIDDILVE